MLKLLAVTTDLKTARDVQGAVVGQFDVVVCNVESRAIKLLETDPNVYAVVVEHVQGTIDAIALLRFTGETRPSARRVMVSAYSDLGPIIQGLHSGAIQQVVHKPIRAAELIMAVGLRIPAARSIEPDVRMAV